MHCVRTISHPLLIHRLPPVYCSFLIRSTTMILLYPAVSYSPPFFPCMLTLFSSLDSCSACICRSLWLMSLSLRLWLHKGRTREVIKGRRKKRIRRIGPQLAIPQAFSSCSPLSLCVYLPLFCLVYSITTQPLYRHSADNMMLWWTITVYSHHHHRVTTLSPSS